MSSNVKNKTVSTANVPNARERASAQFGQVDDQVSGNWDTSTPATLQAAIARIAADLAALKAKLDLDAGVTDTDYNTFKP